MKHPNRSHRTFEGRQRRNGEDSWDPALRRRWSAPAAGALALFESDATETPKKERPITVEPIVRLPENWSKDTWLPQVIDCVTSDEVPSSLTRIISSTIGEGRLVADDFSMVIVELDDYVREGILGVVQVPKKNGRTRSGYVVLSSPFDSNHNA